MCIYVRNNIYIPIVRYTRRAFTRMRASVPSPIASTPPSDHQPTSDVINAGRKNLIVPAENASEDHLHWDAAPGPRAPAGLERAPSDRVLRRMQYPGPGAPPPRSPQNSIPRARPEQVRKYPRPHRSRRACARTQSVRHVAFIASPAVPLGLANSKIWLVFLLGRTPVNVLYSVSVCSDATSRALG